MILNLTQHAATPDQKLAGVVDLPENERKILEGLLTFSSLPTNSKMFATACEIASFAKKYEVFQALIGGAPWFMSMLETVLLSFQVQPLYSFSIRESAEKVNPDGSVVKSNVFRHVGFIEVKPRSYYRSPSHWPVTIDVENRRVHPKAQEALAAYRAKKAAEKEKDL